MKKTTKKLVLAKETVRRMDALTNVRGGTDTTTTAFTTPWVC